MARSGSKPSSNDVFDRHDHTTELPPCGVGAAVASACYDRTVLYINPGIPTGASMPIPTPCFGMIGFLCHLDEGVGYKNPKPPQGEYVYAHHYLLCMHCPHRDYRI